MVPTSLPPCLFPVIEHHVPPKIGHGFFKTGADVRNIEYSRTVTFCTENSISLLTFYKAVWALMLRHFANTDHVFFGVTEASPGRGRIPSAPVGAVREYSRTQSWCHVRLSETNTILEILQRIESDTRCGCPGEGLKLTSASFNTELHLLQGDISEYMGKHDGYLCPYMIDVQLCISPDRIVCRCRASSMTGTAAQGLCETFKKTAASVLANPRQTVPSLDMLCNYDRSRIERWNRVDPWNHTIKACIHDLIHIQVSCQPESLAADGWDGSMTFRELWDQSSRLSYYLHDLGVKQGIMVLFSMALSKWAIIAMLAIPRTGAACVPIDLVDPTHYIQSIEAKLVIADPSQVEQLFGEVKYIITELPNFIDLLGTAPDIYEPQVSPQDPAFVMFTSGVTSTPKPVILGHEAICTNIVHLSETLEINDKSRVFQCSSLAANVSIFDIFGTIAKGGCVCYATEHDRYTDLPRVICTSQATHVFLTPTLLRELTPDSVRSLQVISVTSDGLTINDVLKWQDHVSLFHLYRNTECTICCTATDAHHRERLRYHGRLNIGRAIGCRTWIAQPDNVHRTLVPIGGVGELLIEGATLARGYYVSETGEEGEGGEMMMRPEPFIFDPEWLAKFPSIRTSGRRVRMYRTGDLVRYECDGSIKFVGRMGNVN